MDLSQRKLSKSEWESIEISVSSDEIEVLRLIQSGFNDVNIRYNKHQSLFQYLKIEKTEVMEDFLYTKYFEPKVNTMVSKYKLDKSLFELNINAKLVVKKADKIRLESSSTHIDSGCVFEMLLLDYIEKMFENKVIGKEQWNKYYFTLYKLNRTCIQKINRHILTILNNVLNKYEDEISMNQIIYNASNYIEHNTDLLKYADMVLYQHQKDIFTCVKKPVPKLILYIAPTGTGKTMTPIGLSEKHKIIFVCAARHVGLALARSAISVHKKIAFAFGCESQKDVRLHYFAAKDYTIDKRSGGIRKVDNLVGDDVEIIICDIRSYLPAMYYMLAFNKPNQLLTYWDEPTITMDYDTHDLHSVIKSNWRRNLIPNFVLSSATLPKVHEIAETIEDFKQKFEGSEVISIVSHDCKKTIPIINKDGFVVMPHYLSNDHNEIQRIVKHCSDNLSLLRYFDLKEASEFIQYAEENKLIKSNIKIERNFASLDDIDMKSVKIHYLKVLGAISAANWLGVYSHFMTNRKVRIAANNSVDTRGNPIIKSKSVGPGTAVRKPTLNEGAPLTRMASQQPTITNVPVGNPNCAIYVTTKDAYTLTDGPTIFLANDVEKIAKFCIQQANIPERIIEDIMGKIENNNNVNARIDGLQKLMDDEKAKAEVSSCGKAGKEKSKKDERMEEHNTSINRLKTEIEDLRKLIKSASINDIFIPNKLPHLKKWADGIYSKNTFTSDIDEETVVSIMELGDVEPSWKILLLLGIGVFTHHPSIAYTEIMKKLADKQRLFIIIADSDYIYGTNYQFCHGYLSKDMNLTQEKIIQAMGRIGRNNIQQDYSIRFRDEDQVKILFNTYGSHEKPEVINMNILFNRRDVKFENGEFIIVDDEEYEDVDDEMMDDLENMEYSEFLEKWSDYLLGK